MLAVYTRNHPASGSLPLGFPSLSFMALKESMVNDIIRFFFTVSLLQ